MTYDPNGRFDYNMREKFNMYAGAVIGAVAPIVALKFLTDQDLNFSTGLDIALWIGSGVACAVTRVSSLGFGCGMINGRMAANDLARERLSRESALDNL